MGTYVYDEYRLTLTSRADGAYDAVGVGPDGSAHRGTFALPFDPAELERRVVGIGSRSSRTTRDVATAALPALDAEALGDALAGALLRGAVETGYEAARRAAVSAGRGLRLTLSLGNAPALLSVPWELLRRPPTFLANQRQTPVVRILEVPDLPEPPVVTGTVRILGVTANPSDTAPLDVAAERRRIEQAMAAVVAAGSVTLDWLEPATPRRLREALRDGSYHVLHYVGHGDFTDDGEGVLFLEAEPEDEAADPGHAELDGDELASLLADQASLRLVVLNSCEGARTTLTDPFAGVATTLLRLGVPAVVAMQFPISDRAAILFAEELYTNVVGRGAPIDAAVSEARKAIYIEQGTVEWATPVLFMAETDVELWLRHPEPAPVAVPEPEPEPPLVSASASGRRRALAAVAAGVALVAGGVVAWGVLRPDDDPDVGALVDTSTVEPSPRQPAGTPPAGVLTEPIAFSGAVEAGAGVVDHPLELGTRQLVYVDGRGECSTPVLYRLVSPSGTAVAGAAPSVCHDLGRVEIAEAGQWHLRVEGFDGGAGPYEVVIQPIPPDTVADTAIGAVLRGEIVAAGERHLHRFEGSAGQIVYLRGDGPCGAGVAYRLFSPSGLHLTGAAPFACHDLGRIVLPETGSYELRVESDLGGRGAYELAVLPVAADVVTPVEVGDALTGEIAGPGEHDEFTFQATAGQVVGLDGRGPCGAGVLMVLTTPSGVQLGGAPNVCNDLAPQALPEAGAYTVGVRSDAGGAGVYDVVLHPG